MTDILTLCKIYRQISQMSVNYQDQPRSKQLMYSWQGPLGKLGYLVLQSKKERKDTTLTKYKAFNCHHQPTDNFISSKVSAE